jgi:hypothetical protein
LNPEEFEALRRELAGVEARIQNREEAQRALESSRGGVTSGSADQDLAGIVGELASLRAQAASLRARIQAGVTVSGAPAPSFSQQSAGAGSSSSVDKGEASSKFVGTSSLGGEAKGPTALKPPVEQSSAEKSSVAPASNSSVVGAPAWVPLTAPPATAPVVVGAVAADVSLRSQPLMAPPTAPLVVGAGGGSITNEGPPLWTPPVVPPATPPTAGEGKATGTGGKVTAGGSSPWTPPVIPPLTPPPATSGGKVTTTGGKITATGGKTTTEDPPRWPPPVVPPVTPPLATGGGKVTDTGGTVKDDAPPRWPPPIDPPTPPPATGGGNVTDTSGKSTDTDGKASDPGGKITDTGGKGVDQDPPLWPPPVVPPVAPPPATGGGKDTDTGGKFTDTGGKGIDQGPPRWPPPVVPPPPPPPGPDGVTIPSTDSPRWQPPIVPPSEAPPAKPTLDPPITSARELDELLSQLGVSHPMLLLPVRIETLFAEEAGRRFLKVRIYPDEIFADAHETPLTEAESLAGQAFAGVVQRAVRRAAPAKDDRSVSRKAARNAAKSADRPLSEKEADSVRDAWRELTRVFKPARASWIAHVALSRLSVGRRDGDWTRAVQATLLPDAWMVVAERAAGMVGEHYYTARSRPLVGWSARVRRPLALTMQPPRGSGEVAPTLGASEWVSQPQQLYDAGSAWTVEYDAAVECGMAVTLSSLDDDDWNVGFDRLLVLGVCNLAPDAGAQAVTRLLDAHRYTRGLALVPQGTRTNNTERRSAGYPPTDDDDDGHFSVEWDRRRAARRSPPGDGTDGYYFTRALGLAPAVLAGLEGVEGTEQQSAEAMNRALWPATVGYFVEQILSPLVSPQDVKGLQEHFAKFVRGRGPLPAFRVGRVPYGILPVSSLSRWECPDDKLLRALRNLLLDARRVLRLGPLRDDEYGNLPHAGWRPNAPAQELVEMLSLDASAREVRVRSVMGPDVLAALFRLFPVSETHVQAALRQMREARQRTLPGLPDRAAGMVYDVEALRFNGSFVGPGIADDQTPTTNRFNLLIETTLERLRSGSVLPAGASLLERLLTHALTLELARCTALPVAAAPGDDETTHSLLIEPEIPGITDPQTFWAHLLGDTELSLRRALDDQGSSDPRVANLVPYALSIKTLGTCTGAELERLLTETLDTCSHRIDAWATSLFSQRLEEMRRSKPVGCLVGAFGWVEHLRRRGVSEVRTPLGSPLQSEGFVHAPSLDHAATAAILLNAHLSHKADDAEMFKIRLTSARVRQTLEILDAVRSGQSVNEVFGALLERRLHDLGADICIAPLRERFPPFAARPSGTTPGATSEDLAARTVADGQAAVLAWQQNSNFVQEFRVPEAARGHLTTALAELAATLDGVADTLVAESAFQAVRGNVASANAALKALGQGARAPEPEVVRTPRGGASLTHRILLVLPEGVKAPEWPEDKTPRALLMPALDTWMGSVLGDPAQVRFQVSWSSGGEENERALSLASLKLRPIDVVAMAQESPEGFATNESVPLGATELERRILRCMFDFLPSGASGLKVQFRSAKLARPLVPDVMEVARALQDLLGAARGLSARDVLTPESALAAAPESASVARVLHALTTMRSAYEGLGSGYTQQVIDGLNLAADFGIVDALPETNAFVEGAVEAQVRRVRSELLRRVARAAREDAAESQGSVAPSNDWGTLLGEATGRGARDPAHVLEALFGRRWPIAEGFAPNVWPAPIPDSRDPRLPSAVELPVEPGEVQDWLRQIWRVRPPVAKWRKLSLLTRAMHPGMRGRELTRQTAVAQIEPPLPRGPRVDTNARGYWRWAALRGVWDETAHRWNLPPSGTVSFVALRPLGAPAPGEQWTGLLLDEWTEIVPNDKELTGIAFHYDDPGAEAPQSLLLAVPPDPRVPWTTDALLDTLRETLELARMRAIDLSHLDHYAQVLPAIYLAENNAKETVSTSFQRNLVQDPPSTERPT